MKKKHLLIPIDLGIFCSFFVLFYRVIQQSLIYLTHLISIATKHPYIYTMTSETSDSVPIIKKRSRPQPRVRETSLEKDGDAMQGDEEPPLLPCVNRLFLHVQGST